MNIILRIISVIFGVWIMVQMYNLAQMILKNGGAAVGFGILFALLYFLIGVFFVLLGLMPEQDTGGEDYAT